MGYRLGKEVVTEEFEADIPIDEQMGYDERLRLLYVACTRAMRPPRGVAAPRRSARTRRSRSASRTNAEVLLHGMGDARSTGCPTSAAMPSPSPSTRPPSRARRPTSTRGHAEREAALDVAARPGAVAATALTDEGAPDLARADDARSRPAPSCRPRSPRRASRRSSTSRRRLLADARDPGEPGGRRRRPGPAGADVDPGLQKRPRDLDLPPWLKGRYGTAVGRAVHGVLQTIDLATGDGLDDAVAAQCQAEAVPDRADDVRRLVRGRARRRRRCERPPRAAALAGGLRLHPDRRPAARGLRRPPLPRRPTASSSSTTRPSATADPAELDRRVEGYRLQGAAYARGRRPGHRRAGHARRVPVPHAARRRRARARRPRRRHGRRRAPGAPAGEELVTS